MTRRALALGGCISFAVAIGVVIVFKAIDSSQCSRSRPAVVAYHDGMTVCPGQTVVIPFPIVIQPTRPRSDDEFDLPEKHSSEEL